MLNCSTVWSIACLSIGNGHLLIQWQSGRPNHILQIADYSHGAWLTIQQYGLGYWALWRQPVLLLQMVGPTGIWLFCQLAQITSGSSALRRTRGVQQLHLVKGRRWVCKETWCSSSSNVMLCLFFFLMFLVLKRSWELKKDTFELENKSHDSSSHTETRNRLICLTMSYLLLIHSLAHGRVKLEGNRKRPWLILWACTSWQTKHMSPIPIWSLEPLHANSLNSLFVHSHGGSATFSVIPNHLALGGSGS